MLEQYTNQLIQIKSILNKNEYGDTQTEIKTVKGRLQFKNRLMLNKDGEQVTSTATLYTQNLINLNDLIIYNNKEFRIISISEIAGLDGKIEFLEVHI